MSNGSTNSTISGPGKSTAPTLGYNPTRDNAGPSIKGESTATQYRLSPFYQSSEEGIFSGQTIDASIPFNLILDKDYYPLSEQVQLPTKEAPADLDSLITRKEKIGACIYIIKKDTNGNWRIEFFNNKFYLSSLSISLKEKAQIAETFDNATVSFFDQKVRIYSFSGTAIDWTTSDPEAGYKNFYQSGLIHMYNNVLRGTKLVDNDRIAVLSVANHYIYGYPLNLNITYGANTLNLTQFQMSWLISEHQLSYPHIHVESDLENLYKVPTKKQINTDELLSMMEDLGGAITAAIPTLP